ncbi:uncharacterized protein FRV6_11756 [Fusarium oxysporum]|uniref:Uncharacterized protein n=1 Tax=Fusarium oxysporum TaxID=5507 RepID=A0A2H3U0C1_FUSOX|nr:uncharacterized protein FRV6_11756 [Fusarium oxysporum]
MANRLLADLTTA